ncbi:MAG: hypothetical protein ABIE70_00555 [bacterium]
MRKIGFFFALGLALAAVVNIPDISVAGGLSTQLGEVVIENLQIGQTYNLRELANLQLIVTNTGEISVDLQMDVLVPDSGELKQGAAAVPDVSWIALSRNLFALEPNQNATADVVISIPDDDQFLGKKYQVNVWSHTLGVGSMNLAVGLKSRIIFTTDTVKADAHQVSTRSSASVDFTMAPGEIYVDNVPLGKSHDIGKAAGKVLTVTNNGEREQVYKIQSRTVANSSATLTADYVDTPDAAFLSFDKYEFTLSPMGTTTVNMYLEFPPKEEFAGKNFMFIIRAYTVGDEVSTGVYSRVYASIQKSMRE